LQGTRCHWVDSGDELTKQYSTFITGWMRFIATFCQMSWGFTGINRLSGYLPQCVRSVL